VLGLLSSSLTGIGVASITGGISATMTALGEAKVTSELSKASIVGKTGVDVSAEVGSVNVLGTVDVEAKAMTRSASLYGGTRAYVGSGPGAGFGMIATPMGLKAGAILAANMCSSAASNPSCALEFTATEAILAVGASSMSMRPFGLDVKALEVGITSAGPVNVKGSVVLLG
jgi:hypothetical protein